MRADESLLRSARVPQTRRELLQLRLLSLAPRELRAQPPELRQSIQLSNALLHRRHHAGATWTQRRLVNGEARGPLRRARGRGRGPTEQRRDVLRGLRPASLLHACHDRNELEALYRGAERRSDLTHGLRHLAQRDALARVTCRDAAREGVRDRGTMVHDASVALLHQRHRARGERARGQHCEQACRKTRRDELRSAGRDGRVERSRAQARRRGALQIGEKRWALDVVARFESPSREVKRRLYYAPRERVLTVVRRLLRLRDERDFDALAIAVAERAGAAKAARDEHARVNPKRNQVLHHRLCSLL